MKNLVLIGKHILYLVTICFFSFSYASMSEKVQPELISPGNISSVFGEYSPTFDVNSSELVFMRRTPGEFDYTLYSTKLENGKWTYPKKLPFSGTHRDGGPYFSPDGKLLAFDSRRPATGLSDGSINLWVASRESEQDWDQPKLLQEASTNETSETRAGVDEFGPVIRNNGDILFYSFRSPKREGSFYTASKDQQPTMLNELPDPSRRTFVGYITLSSDGKTAVIEGEGQNSNLTDLYYTCRDENGWGKAKPLESINTVNGEGTPFLTADNLWLWFASDRDTGNTESDVANIYRVSTKHLPIPCG